MESLLPEAEEFTVELSLDGDGPSIVCQETMRLEHILNIAKTQGFKVNDICGVRSGGYVRDCIGIALDKPFLHDETNESIAGLFVVGNPFTDEIKCYLYSFLVGAVTTQDETIRFSVDTTATNKRAAKAMLSEKLVSLHDASTEEAIRFIPAIDEKGEWIEMEPIEEDGAFMHNKLEVLRLGENHFSIPHAGFSHNKLLKLVLPENTQDIQSNAFGDNPPHRNSV